jgi:hypothetical protein
VVGRDGTFIFASAKFEGDWKNDKPHGKGIFSLGDYSKY